MELMALLKRAEGCARNDHRWWCCGIGGGPRRVFSDYRCENCPATKRVESAVSRGEKEAE